VAQAVASDEKKVCPESESLKFSATPTPQVENPSDSSTPTPQPWWKPCSHCKNVLPNKNIFSENSNFTEKPTIYL